MAARKQVIFDSSLLNEAYNEDVYSEEVKDNSITYEDWYNENIRFEYEDLESRIIMVSSVMESCIIEGVLGLWDGKHEIVPTFENNFAYAINRCTKGNEDISIVIVGNKIEVEVNHHDGTNKFSIYFLSEKGEERYRRNGQVSVKNRENLMKIPKDILDY